jgi:NAD(P)-dependent dehydrogenase (short-subunit alcohol dehydrogenase family)
LVNNAAVGSFSIKDMPLSERMQESFKTNVTGPALMLEAFWPLLMKSETTPRIINVSSGAGSMGSVLKMPAWQFGEVPIPYFTSKAGLNMVSCSWILGHREENYKLFTYCPGFTESNIGPHNNAASGAQPTVDGTKPMVAILNGEKDAEHGGFLNHQGGQHPW